VIVIEVAFVVVHEIFTIPPAGTGFGVADSCTVGAFALTVTRTVFCS
jgi:hypothetical protein